ncbi:MULTISPECIES: response regulator [unclassified Geodermatophilus]
MAKVRVLVVDDQEPFRRAAGAVVSAVEEFELVGAVDSGEAAVDAVAATHPDLVVMDVSLPGISGLEATRRITTGPHTAGTRVLLVSTYDVQDLDDVSACGAGGFLSKVSLDPDRLRAAWHDLLG